VSSPDADRIVAAIEGTLREWIMESDRAEVLAVVDSVLRDHDPAGLYFLAKQDVREIWEKHLGPHKCDVHGVDKFLAALEAWMMEEKP
jgi:hypothetical protein